MQQTAPIEIGIRVLDLDVMLGFYTRVLDCREVRRAPIPAALSKALALAADGYTCVWLQTPNGEHIKLMSMPDTPERSASSAFLGDRAGIRYLTFYCSDLVATLTAAEAAGATLISERSLTRDQPGVDLCFFTDPEGNVIELVQPATASAD